MANSKDLLGALLSRGMTESTANRVQNSLSEEGIGGLGGILEQLGFTPAKESVGAKSKQGSKSEGLPDVLGNLGSIAKSVLGGEGKQGNALAAGGLGALVGALLGGGGKSAKGALGGGALALLGSIALQALRASQQKSVSNEIDSAARLTAGLREPENAQEEKHVGLIADLTVKAMINAAKADGQIDEDEMQKVVGELQEGGISEEERDYLLTEVRKPLNTAEIVRGASSPQVAAQVYAASLLAIEVDTPAEKAYVQGLVSVTEQKCHGRSNDIVVGCKSKLTFTAPRNLSGGSLDSFSGPVAANSSARNPFAAVTTRLQSRTQRYMCLMVHVRTHVFPKTPSCII